MVKIESIIIKLHVGNSNEYLLELTIEEVYDLHNVLDKLLKSEKFPDINFEKVTYDRT